MANLVIMESPSKAANVKGYLGSNYKVIACIGHVRDLPKSSFGVDIEHGFEPHYINIRGRGDVIKEIRKEAKAANKVYLATDPDREGEAIAWHLSVILGIPLEKTQRITFNEVTKTAVKAAIKVPRQVDMHIVNAQQTRRILDRIVGYKLTPILWKNVRSGLSAGRVQSVATRVLVEREEEIRRFVPEEYWTVDASLLADGKPFLAHYYGETGGGKRKLTCEAEAMAVVHDTDSQSFTVTSVKRSERHKQPAPPFTTSTMQQDASRKLNFQSQKIMRVAQELYEGVNLGPELGGTHGLITYMRTDSLRIAEEAQVAARAFILQKYGEKYYPETPRVYKAKSGAQDAHEAIRPVRADLEPSMVRKYLTNDQYKLYKLIWERFIASQMQSAALSVLQIEATCHAHVFRAGGYTVTFPGYMALYEESVDEGAAKDTDDEKEIRLPDLQEGVVLPSEAITPYRHFTEAPPRFTEASLIKFLEEKGIGRPSTWATIITTITQRTYVVRDGKSLVPTPLGEITTNLMKENFSSVVDYRFTAQVEDELDAVEKGTDTTQHVLEGFWEKFDRQLIVAQEKLATDSIQVPVEETDMVCEKCGSKMIVKNGRYGKFAACPNYPKCRNTKPLTPPKKAEDAQEESTAETVPEGMKCELCGADMVLRTGRYGSFYACSRYPTCKYTKQKVRKLDVACPICGAAIVVKHGRNRSTFYSCERYPACDFSSWDLPTNEKCPQCGGMLFRKKGKPMLVCHDSACGYTRQVEPELLPAEKENGEKTE